MWWNKYWLIDWFTFYCWTTYPRIFIRHVNSQGNSIILFLFFILRAITTAHNGQGCLRHWPALGILDRQSRAFQTENWMEVWLPMVFKSIPETQTKDNDEHQRCAQWSQGYDSLLHWSWTRTWLGNTTQRLGVRVYAQDCGIVRGTNVSTNR